MTDILAGLAYLHGKPSVQAKLKAKPEHFIVKEVLGYEFAGSGEHLMVKIRKTGENTTFVANELAKVCGVKSKDVSWAGLKDRHAVTEQWLSVHLPKGDAPDFTAFEQQYPSIQVLETTRHTKKLRPGELAGNRFSLTLSEVTDTVAVLEKLALVSEYGVPNYFGAQRFGRGGSNLEEARRWGRDNVRTRNQNKRSMYLSAARSWIFNQIVSARIQQGRLNTLLSGDLVLAESELLSVTDENRAELEQKLATGAIQLTAALAGDNALPTTGDALHLEQPLLDAEPDLMALIRGNRMRHDRREVVLKPGQMQYDSEGDTVRLSFSLPSGCFATSVIRELVEEVPVERHYSQD
jgi:tRNA pseudouridine13 synthase